MQFSKKENQENHKRLVSNLYSPFWESSFSTSIVLSFSSHKESVVCVPFQDRTTVERSVFEEQLYRLSKMDSERYYWKYSYPLMRDGEKEMVKVFENMKVECLERQRGGGIQYKSIWNGLNFFF